MAQYKVQAPDGRTVTLEGDTPPTEADLDQVFSTLPAAAPVAPKTSPEAQARIQARNASTDAFNTSPMDVFKYAMKNPAALGAGLSEAGTAIGRGINTATFGLGKRAEALGLAGLKGTSYGQELGGIEAGQEDFAKRHPLMAFGEDVAGSLASPLGALGIGSKLAGGVFKGGKIADLAGQAADAVAKFGSGSAEAIKAAKALEAAKTAQAIKIGALGSGVENGLSGYGTATGSTQDRLLAGAAGFIGGNILGGAGTKLGMLGQKILGNVEKNPLATLGQAADSETFKKGEANLAQGFLGGGLRERQIEQAQDVLGKIKELNPMGAGSTYEFGKTLGKTGEAAKTFNQNKWNKIFDTEIYSQLPEKTNTALSGENILSKLTELKDSNYGAQKKVYEKIFNDVKKDVDAGKFNIDRSLNFKHTLGDSVDKYAAKQLNDAAIKDVESGIAQNAPEGQAENLINKYKTAREAYKEYSTTGGVKDTIKNLASTDAAEREKEALSLIRKTQEKKGGASHIEAVFNSIEDPQVAETMRQSILKNLGVNGVGQMGTTTQYYNQLRGMSKEARKILMTNKITGADESPIYESIAERVKDLKNVPLNFTGSAASIQDAAAGLNLQSLGTNAASVLPALAGASIGGSPLEKAEGAGVGAAGTLGVAALALNPKLAGRVLSPMLSNVFTHQLPRAVSNIYNERQPIIREQKQKEEADRLRALSLLRQPNPYAGGLLQ